MDRGQGFGIFTADVISIFKSVSFSGLVGRMVSAGFVVAISQKSRLSL